MNAPAPIQIVTIEAAIERANKWVDVARPVIKAMFAVEDAQSPVRKARLADPKGYAFYAKMSPEARIWEEAESYLTKCREQLSEMLDGIRDNYLCDERMPGPQESEPDDPVARQALDNAWSDADDFNDELERGCLSTDAAVKLVEAEHNAAFWGKQA
jgi:hypothetical protein